MKKVSRILLSLSLAAVMLFGITACAEGVPMKTGGTGTAIGLGHQGCIAEVTVIVDGLGQISKVQFDEIFPVKDVAGYADLSTTKVGGVALVTDKVTIAEKVYHKYLHIGDKYFVASETVVGMYSEIGGTSAITDLYAYAKTDEGIKWYYDSFMAGKMQVCKTDADGTAVGDVTLKDIGAFNTSSGSMRKRYSKYWSSSSSISQFSGLGFNGNMDALENYILAYGFDGHGNIKLPKDSGTKFNQINGIMTGATLNADTALYMNVAKKAYDMAIATQKDM